MRRYGILWLIIKLGGHCRWGISMCSWELMISIRRPMPGRMAWRSGRSLIRSRKLSRVYSSHPRRYWKFRRRGSISLKNRRIRKRKGKIRKIRRTIRLFRTRIRMRWLSLRRRLRISWRRPFINRQMGNGMSMMRRKGYGFSRKSSQHRRWKWWSNFSLIS